MGKIHRGIPHHLALKLQEVYDLQYFIETGTYRGRTARWAAGHFFHVWSIEKHPVIYAEAYRDLRALPNLTLRLGNSKYLLGEMLEAVPGQALIWLDAHWHPELRIPQPDEECPVLGELAAIKDDGGPHIILIDDASYFSEPPPDPHRAQDWPAYEVIVDSIADWQVRIADDVIIATPRPGLRRGW